MAWLEQTASGQFHVAFRFGDQKYKKSGSSGGSVVGPPDNEDVIGSLSSGSTKGSAPFTFAVASTAAWGDGRCDGEGERG